MINSNRVAGAASTFEAASVANPVPSVAGNDNRAGAGFQKHRVAPGAVKTVFSVSERFCRQPQDGSAYAGRAQIEIDGRKVKIQRLLRAGVPVTVKLQASQFIGVAMRAESIGGGLTDVHLELLHRDPLLCIPLMISQSDVFLASDWRAWASQLCLPMVVTENDGQITPLTHHIGDIEVNTPTERRKRSNLAVRRPRFLAKRRMGSGDTTTPIVGEELIARR